MRRPSPALVVALVAVVFAIGGFAFAAAIPDRTGVIHACYKKKKGALRVVSAKRRCSKRERSLTWNQRGRTGARGRTGSRGRTGRTGATGPAGPEGSARAFALVNGTAATGGDTVDGAKSKGVSDSQVTHPGTGIYCFNLGFTPGNVVATADWQSSGTNVVAAASLTDSPACSGSESASVTLRNVETATDKDGNFYVAFN
jgi:hypothetical protein